MEFGLKDHVLRKLREVFNSFPDIHEAVIYGSRALGTYREGSDIDISLKGNLNLDQMLQIEKRIDDLMLPYMVDVSIYNKLTNKNFLDHINRVGKTLYEKEKVKE